MKLRGKTRKEKGAHSMAITLRLLPVLLAIAITGIHSLLQSLHRCFSNALNLSLRLIFVQSSACDNRDDIGSLKRAQERFATLPVIRDCTGNELVVFTFVIHDCRVTTNDVLHHS